MFHSHISERPINKSFKWTNIHRESPKLRTFSLNYNVADFFLMY